MSQNFKTCVFGGFDKQDVVSYLEEQAKQHADEVAALQQDKSDLRDKLKELAAACETLRERADRLERAENEVLTLRGQVAALTEQCSGLQAAYERCKGPAEEYEKLRDHIAEIEISAHKRTEEFRAKAIDQLRGMVAQQRDWCGRERQRYDIVQQDVLQKLQQAQNMVEGDSGSAFDQMLAGLQAFEDGLEK
jgi:predicted RNase H-like nuclease (RuvC/YqgF family)